MDEFELVEDNRRLIACPYCSGPEEFDLVSLHSHLEDKHQFGSQSTAGPVSLVNVDWGLENHLTEKHMMTSVRGRKLDISAIPRSQGSSPLRWNQKDSRDSDFGKLFGSSRLQCYRGHSSSASADPVIPSFRSKFNTSEKTDEITKYLMSFMEESSESKASECLWKSSLECNSLSREEWEERMREAAARSAFVQDMLVSTLLPD